MLLFIYFNSGICFLKLISPPSLLIALLSLSPPLSLCLSISLSLSVSQDRELRASRAAMNDSSSPLCVLGLAKVLVKRRENPDRGVTDTQVWGGIAPQKKNKSGKTTKALVV